MADRLDSVSPIVAVRAYFLASLPGISVGTRVQNPRLSNFVRIRRAGGNRDDLVLDTSRVLIECWHTDYEAAEALADRLVGVFVSMEGRVLSDLHVTRAEILALPFDDPDPDSATPRFTLTGQLTTFAVPQSI